jgi:HAE1 family hydrophobic/amphiphilic exporter-1
LGVIALCGIVVNDAIVLIDRININRRSGMEFAESISEATQSRLQPILMTSITTIVGILPLALTNEFWSGLGFSLIFGLIASTILTLIIMPVLYYIFEGKNARKQAMVTNL